MLVARDKAWNQWYTAQNVADRADVKTGLAAAACCVIHHWDSVALHNRVWRDVDWLKGAEKYQGHLGQLSVTVSVGPLSHSGTHCAVEAAGAPGLAYYVRPWQLMSISLLRSKSSGLLGSLGNGAITHTQSCHNMLF